MSLKWEKWVLFLRVAPIARAIVFLQLLIREGVFDQGATEDHSFLPSGKKTQNSLKGGCPPWEQTTTLNPNVS